MFSSPWYRPYPRVCGAGADRDRRFEPDFPGRFLIGFPDLLPGRDLALVDELIFAFANILSAEHKQHTKQRDSSEIQVSLQDRIMAH